MRYLFFIPVFLLFAGCTSSDSNRIQGNWNFYRSLDTKGKLVYSTDPAEKEAAVIRMMKTFGQDPAKQQNVQRMMTNLDNTLGKLSFEFEGTKSQMLENGTNTTGNYSDFLVDQKNKTLIMTDSKGLELIYTYKLIDDTLTLISGETIWVFLRE